MLLIIYCTVVRQAPHMKVARLTDPDLRESMWIVQELANDLYIITIHAGIVTGNRSECGAQFIQCKLSPVQYVKRASLPSRLFHSQGEPHSVLVV